MVMWSCCVQDSRKERTLLWMEKSFPHPLINKWITIWHDSVAVETSASRSIHVIRTYHYVGGWEAAALSESQN